MSLVRVFEHITINLDALRRDIIQVVTIIHVLLVIFFIGDAVLTTAYLNARLIDHSFVRLLLYLLEHFKVRAALRMHLMAGAFRRTGVGAVREVVLVLDEVLIRDPNEV